MMVRLTASLLSAMRFPLRSSAAGLGIRPYYLDIFRKPRSLRRAAAMVHGPVIPSHGSFAESSCPYVFFRTFESADQNASHRGRSSWSRHNCIKKTMRISVTRHLKHVGFKIKNVLWRLVQLKLGIKKYTPRLECLGVPPEINLERPWADRVHIPSDAKLRCICNTRASSKYRNVQLDPFIFCLTTVPKAARA